MGIEHGKPNDRSIKGESKRTFLSINEAAAKTGYDINWIWRLVKNGVITSSKRKETILVERTRTVTTINIEELEKYKHEKRGPNKKID